MGLFDKFFSGLQKTQNRLSHEIKRIVTRSPKLTSDDLEELEATLLGADIGFQTTEQIIGAVRTAYESGGKNSEGVLETARAEIEHCLGNTAAPLAKTEGLTVISLVGVNGTGKTTTAAKLARRIMNDGGTPMLAACDTFRAAAIEQLNLWGERLGVPVISGQYGADPAAVAHDAVSSALARNADCLLVDTAGRLHTRHNLMQELGKLHRVLGKQLEGAPHEVLLVLDAATGMNALAQALEFNKQVPLTGLVITKLDGTSKGGMVVAIQRELKLPVKYIGLGEQPDDLQPFSPQAYAHALFFDKEMVN